MDERDLMERATSFGSAADDYARYRPPPPADAAAWAVAASHVETVVDLAAGTGNVTRYLLPLADRVIAVDLDARMLGTLGRRVGPVARIQARGEELPLPSASADSVVISSAWHWLDPDRAWPEVARVIRPGGTLGVVYGGPDRTVEWVADVLEGGSELQGWRDRRRIQIPSDAPFADLEHQIFTAIVPWRSEDLPRLAASYSRLLVLSEDERRSAMDAVAERVRRRPELAGEEQVELPIRTIVFRARRT